MKAVDFINSNLNQLEILNYYAFDNISTTTDEIRASCKLHGGNNPSAFVWNLENNLWYCHTGDCGGGDVYTLVMKIEGVSFTESVKRIADILKLDIADMKISRRTNAILNDTKKWLEFMKSKNKKEEFKPYILPYTKYWSEDKRFTRFKTKTIQEFNATFCNIYPLEETLLYNKIVIPIMFNNILYGVALRSLTNSTPKWMFQPKGAKIGNLLYNFDKATKVQSNKIVLVEGIFDVWAYHEIGIENVACIFGSKLKREQKNILLRSGKDLILSFDNDDAGNKCTEEVIKEFKYKAGIEVVTLPQGCDPADCQKHELENCYINRSKI